MKEPDNALHILRNTRPIGNWHFQYFIAKGFNHHHWLHVEHSGPIPKEWCVWLVRNGMIKKTSSLKNANLFILTDKAMSYMALL